MQLLQSIDNLGGSRQVAVRSFTYWVGWHNIENGEWISWNQDGQEGKTLSLTPGLYSYQLLEDTLTDAFTDLFMDVGKADGVVTFIIPEGARVMFSEGCARLLGLKDEGWLGAGMYRGDEPVDFMPVKALHIYLDQLSTTENVMDGAPSQLLAVFLARCEPFGAAETFNPRPEFKKLAAGAISELKVRVTDEHHRLIDNHGLPMSVTLEIK